MSKTLDRTERLTELDAARRSLILKLHQTSDPEVQLQLDEVEDAIGKLEREGEREVLLSEELHRLEAETLARAQAERLHALQREQEQDAKEFLRLSKRIWKSLQQARKDMLSLKGVAGRMHDRARPLGDERSWYMTDDLQAAVELAFHDFLPEMRYPGDHRLLPLPEVAETKVWDLLDEPNTNQEEN